MDKNTILGFILIGIVLFAFSWLNKPTPEQIEAQNAQRRHQDSLAIVERSKLEQADQEQRQAEEIAQALPDSVKQAQQTVAFGEFATAVTGTEEFITLENEKVELRFSSKGGRLAYARLKEYKTYDKQPLVLFDEADSEFDITMITASNRVVSTKDLYFTPKKGADGLSVTMRLNLASDHHLDFVYRLSPDDYFLDLTIAGEGMNGILSPATNSLDISWKQNIRQLEQVAKFENQYTGLYYKYAADDVEKLNENKNDAKQLSNRLKWIGYKNKYFATTMIAGEGFEATRMSSAMMNDKGYLKKFETTTSIPFSLTGEPSDIRYFIGPTRYNLLKAYDKDVPKEEQLDLDNLVPLGYKWIRPINKYFILPIFDFFSSRIASIGLVIFLLTLVVKMVLFPLTYKSYMSSAKMRVLRPQVEAINAKFPKQEQAMERQKATMDLYSRAGASPMSGCLPQLLMFPFLIALYMLFPTSIELRQESFLWVKDMSTYDPIVSWNVNIPIISSLIGNHISLFCLIMTIVQIVYTKINMAMTNTGQQQMPGMNMMMYLMPVIMFVFFNQNSAALSYYFLISTLITIAQTMSFRLFVNEEKLLAKLEANKKKPKKKSGFMERLEEAQKTQEQTLKKQQNQRQQQSKAQQQKRDDRKK